MTHEQPLTVDEDRAAVGGEGLSSPAAADRRNEDPAHRSVARLRGADVQVDARKAGWVALALALATLLILSIIFTVAGFHKNQQIQELREHAVPIDVTVTSCVGLLGGSGTNLVGYSCTGAYTTGAHRYTGLLPGTAPHARGAIVHAVVVPSDPGLISTAAVVASEHASWQVFILPALLFLVMVAIAILVAVASGRGRKRPQDAGAAG